MIIKKHEVGTSAMRPRHVSREMWRRVPKKLRAMANREIRTQRILNNQEKNVT